MDKLEVVDFDRVTHMRHLFEWLKLRGEDFKVLDDLPKLGVIATYKNIGVAAAFLRRVEPEYGLLDGLITNPEALLQLKSEGVDMVVEKIIQKARDLKLSAIWAYSTLRGVLERSKQHGFKELPDKIICLNLKQGDL